MAEPRFVTPLMPSLLHFATVKVAVGLFQECGVVPLEVAYDEIERGNLTISERRSAQGRRAKAILIHIPDRLRKGLMKAVYGVRSSVVRWRFHHSAFNVQTHHLHWRSEGSIDQVRTAQDLVRNPQFDLRERFRLACKYFLEESSRALWAELLQTGEARRFNTRGQGADSLWARWLQGRPRSSWTEGLLPSLVAWLQRFPDMNDFNCLRYSAFFHVLTAEQRRHVRFSSITSTDDLRFCLYALTREEEELVLARERVPCKVLIHHLDWPLQSLFLQTAERMHIYLNGHLFRHLVNTILDCNDYLRDYDYAELFRRYWFASPIHWREFAREDNFLRGRIDYFFEQQ